MFVLTQFNSASLNKHIKTLTSSVHSARVLWIFLRQNKRLIIPGGSRGTADAVRQSLKHIGNNDFEYVLILSGDQLYQMDFAEMIDKSYCS